MPFGRQDNRSINNLFVVLPSVYCFEAGWIISNGIQRPYEENCQYNTYHGKAPSISLQYPSFSIPGNAPLNKNCKRKHTEENMLYPDPIIRKKCTAPNHFYVPQKYFPLILNGICLPFWGDCDIHMILVPVYMGICDGDVWWRMPDISGGFWWEGYMKSISVGVWSRPGMPCSKLTVNICI